MIASLYRNAIVLTIIVVITVIATVMVWNHHKYLHYESEFNELFLPLVNERNNEKKKKPAAFAGKNMTFDVLMTS